MVVPVAMTTLPGLPSVPLASRPAVLLKVAPVKVSVPPVTTIFEVPVPLTMPP